MEGRPRKGPEPDLAPYVEKAKGIQPWRRLLHAASGASIPLALGAFHLERTTALVILGSLFVLFLLMDALRLYLPDLNLFFFRAFQSLVSPREEKNVASSTWYAASALLVLLLFPLPYALAGILVLALADPAAAVVGWNWGRRTFGTGTALGSATFAGVAFLALLVFVPWWAALVVALFAAVVEAAPLPVDDNLVVPVVVAGALALMGA